jgi:hypothetical protein
MLCQQQGTMWEKSFEVKIVSKRRILRKKVKKIEYIKWAYYNLLGKFGTPELPNILLPIAKWEKKI